MLDAARRVEPPGRDGAQPASSATTRATEIVKEAAASGRTVREVAIEKGVDAKTLDEALDYRRLRGRTAEMRAKGRGRVRAALGACVAVPGSCRAARARAPGRSCRRGGTSVFPEYRVVGFYGAPQATQLGELGIGSPASAAKRLRQPGQARMAPQPPADPAGLRAARDDRAGQPR